MGKKFKSDSGTSDISPEKNSGLVSSRRSFLKGLGAAALAGTVPLAAGAAGALPDVLSDTSSKTLNIKARPGQAYQKRLNAAASDRKIKVPAHPTNGDEALYPSGIANFTKGFAHNSFGEIDPTAYAQYLAAVKTGKLADFEALPLGGNTPLVDPQAGIAFDLETCDASQNSIPAFATLPSAGFASQMIEEYWMALVRDVPFSQWGSDPTVAAAVSELNANAAYQGPKPVTPQNLFRGVTHGETVGPYVSQLLLQPFAIGAMPFQGYQTTLPGDFGTNPTSWLALQNGQGPFGSASVDPTLRFLHDGRALAEYVHNDVLYQEYLAAALMLAKMKAPLNSGNPYGTGGETSETGFITFGFPMVQVLVAEVIARAIKNAWFQKWFIHRVARPEEYAGLVHFTQTGARSYPVDSSVLNSNAAAQVFADNGNYFIPLSYPEGCPLHPSYPSGHATAAGAAATVLKWFFNGTFVTPNPLTTINDGSGTAAYTGSDAGQITVGGEINKLAANVGFGRMFAGIHWRQDILQGMILGETVAISLLKDQAHLYNENYKGFTFTKFDGTPETV
jgi:membrane-associated phospholipid phosphatase